MSLKYDSGFRWYHDSVIWGVTLGSNVCCVVSKSIGVGESMVLCFTLSMLAVVICLCHSWWLSSRSN